MCAREHGRAWALESYLHVVQALRVLDCCDLRPKKRAFFSMLRNQLILRSATCLLRKWLAYSAGISTLITCISTHLKIFRNDSALLLFDAHTEAWLLLNKHGSLAFCDD